MFVALIVTHDFVEADLIFSEEEGQGPVLQIQYNTFSHESTYEIRTDILEIVFMKLTRPIQPVLLVCSNFYGRQKYLSITKYVQSFRPTPIIF